jgi:uncharacterized protein (DUF58 family)
MIELAPDAPDAIEIDRRILAVAVPAGAPALIELTIKVRRLGRRPWTEMRVRASGPLGLAWWSRRLNPDFTLEATPDSLRGAAQRFGALANGPRSRFVRGGGAEVLQLREYRAGDPLHLIDWKASARSRELVSRDFAEDQHLDIVIAIDIGRSSALRAGELDRLGLYSNVAARFAEHAVAQDDRVGLLLFADRPVLALAPARGVSAVVRIRAALASAATLEAESDPLTAALRIRALAGHRSLVVLMTELEDAAVAGRLAAAARLLAPKHLPLIVGFASREVEQLRHAPARTWLDPYESLAAQEYCASLERNVRALRALGAPALLALPQQMENAVFEAYAQLRLKRSV